jgi:hypothetical protein
MENQQARRRQRKPSEMYPIVESYMRSDQSREAFCQEAGISVSALSYWQTKYRKSQSLNAGQSSSSFIPISVSPSQGVEAVLELVLGNGKRLRFMGYPEVDYLQQLIG